MSEAEARRIPPAGRVVVVQAEGPEPLLDARAAVGVTRFDTAEGPRLGVIVKLALSALDDERAPLEVARLSRERPALSLDRPSRFGADLGAPGGVLDYASDFSPRKVALDLSVVGHAHAPRATDTIEGELRAAGVFLAFVVRAGGAALALPLVPPYLAVEPLVGRLAPAGDPSRRGRRAFEGDFDFGLFNAAPPPLRGALGALAPNAELRLKGLLPKGATALRLPGLYPVVSVETVDASDEPVATVLDTFWLDADTGEIALVWRGEIALAAGDHEIDRIVVSLELAGQERDAETRLADLQRGHVHFATTEDDVAGGRAPPDDDARLEMARYATWASVAPQPRLPLPLYARINAELGEEPVERRRVLERHGLDEDRWVVEERAWLERFAGDAADGDTRLVTRSGELYVEAQDALARPEEATWGLEHYARLRVATEASDDPVGVLGRVPMTLPQWMRLERRWLARAGEDPEIARELERRLSELKGAEPEEEEGEEPATPGV